MTRAVKTTFVEIFLVTLIVTGLSSVTVIQTLITDIPAVTSTGLS